METLSIAVRLGKERPNSFQRELGLDGFVEPVVDAIEGLDEVRGFPKPNREETLASLL